MLYEMMIICEEILALELVELFVALPIPEEAYRLSQKSARILDGAATLSARSSLGRTEGSAARAASATPLP